jgi:pentose-5-phosphate-3-epimerase
MNFYPRILTDSITKLQEQVSAAASTGDTAIVHIDIIDGYFADNVTITPLDLTQIDFGDLQIDLHLIVEEPMDFVHEIIGVEEYLPIRGIIAQVERMSFQEEFLQEVRKHRWKAGLSLDLYTPVSAVDASSWDNLDIIQLMTAEAGTEMQTFNKNALEKITTIRGKTIERLEVLFDGGITQEHIQLIENKDGDSVTVDSEVEYSTHSS